MLGLVLLGLMWLNSYTSRPFKTQYQFIEHLRNERFDEAKALIEPADRSRIPEHYWEQFRGHPPESLISPTGLTFINGRMAMVIYYPNDTGDHPSQ